MEPVGMAGQGRDQAWYHRKWSEVETLKQTMGSNSMKREKLNHWREIVVSCNYLVCVWVCCDVMSR